MKSLFGSYNLFIDGGVHIGLCLITSALYFFSTPSGWFLTSVIFFSGILIDADHFLNPPIARLYKLPKQKTSFGNGGITIKILHGFDIALFAGWIGLLLSGNGLFAVYLFINLVLHELWDFLVYSHTYHELFLLTRVMKKFKPGTRRSMRGLFFDEHTLKM